MLLGDQADVLLVAARTDDGVGLFEVDPARVTRTHTPAMDTTLRLATLRLDGCPGTPVATDAAAALARAHLVGTVAVAALQVGCAQRALDMTVAYSLERVQFGRQIGSFQALKHRMADMLVRVETSRSISWAAAHAVSVSNADADRLAAVAGSYCADALRRWPPRPCSCTAGSRSPGSTTPRWCSSAPTPSASSSARPTGTGPRCSPDPAPAAP